MSPEVESTVVFVQPFCREERWVKAMLDAYRMSAARLVQTAAELVKRGDCVTAPGSRIDPPLFIVSHGDVASGAIGRLEVVGIARKQNAPAEFFCLIRNTERAAQPKQFSLTAKMKS